MGSHDRALLRETCDEFWLVTRGGVLPFDGDLDDYQKWLLEVSRAAARGLPPPEPPRPGQTAAPAPAPRPATAASRPSATPAPPAAAAPREDRKAAKQSRARLAESTRPLRIELQRIDERLPRLAREKTGLEERLAQPAAGADDYAELGRGLAHVSAEIAMLEERWLELHSELEALQTGP